MESGSSSICAPELPAGNRDATSAPVSQSVRRESALGFLVLVVVLSALPFLPALRYGFVYDDDVQVVNTVAVRSIQSAKDYFLTSVWALRNSAIPLNYNYYRPLFYFWLRISAAMFGLHPLLWHLSVLLMHLAVTALVFLLLRRHLQNSWAAVAGSLVFGLHPAHIESVVWISGATDPLAALGVLGSFLLWLRKTETPRISLLAASLTCYAAALMCKETAVALPAIVFVYALVGVPGTRHPAADRRSGLRFAVLEVTPFLAVTAFYFAVRLAVLHAFRAGSAPWLSRSAVALTAPSVLLFYSRHLVWPVGLRLFYDFTPVQSLASAQFWIPFILVGAIALAAIAVGRRLGSNISAAAAWILIPILPVLDIGLFFRDDFLHDRYLYLPSVGLALLVGIAMQHLSRGAEASPKRTAALAGFTLICVFLAASTTIQAAPWKDNLSLYSHAAEHSSNTMARVNLASELSDRGHYEEARTILLGVIRERPDFWLVNYNLGYVSYRLKDLDAAERLLRHAIAINPREADAYEYLGLTFFRENRIADARAMLIAAIERNSLGQGYHFALGVVLRQQGYADAANAEFAQELKNHPENSVIRAEVAQLESQSSAGDASSSGSSR